MNQLFFSQTKALLACLSLGAAVMATPSVEAPLFISETTTITLTQDIRITSKGSPFIATGSFGKNGEDRLIISSDRGNAIIVSKEGLWDLSSFNGSRKSIEFRGNARLIMEPGARLLGSDTTLIFSEQSRIE